MKRFIYSLLSLSLLAVSCENINEGTVWDNPKFMRLTAYTEKVAVSADDSLSISWAKGHEMSVFAENSKAVTLSTNSTTTNVFFTYDWYEGAKPEYAVFPASDDATCTADGVLTVTLPSEQKVSGTGKVENFVAVGRIVGNRTSYMMNPIRNVTGHIALSLSSEVKSIKIEAVADGESVSGRVNVDCDALVAGEADYLSVVESQNSVTLVPAEENGTLKKGTHYVSVLPGEYKNGFKVTVSPDGVTSFEKVYLSGGVTVGRSVLSSCGDEPADDNLPGDVRIDLDFSQGWPFVEPITTPEEQIASGYTGMTYTYQYKYSVPGSPTEYHRNFSFFMQANKCVYAYNGEALTNGTAAFGRITLPDIAGRYIKALKVETLNDAEHGKKIRLRDKSWVDLVTCDHLASFGSPAMLSFPLADGTSTALSAGYYLYFDTVGSFIKNISIIYSRELPATGEENPFGDAAPVAQPMPDDFDVTLDFAADWPFNGSCMPAEAQSDLGEPYTYTYNYELDGVPQTRILDFALWRGSLGTTKSYVYENGGVLFKTDSKDNSTAMIKFPVIEGRYLKSVTAVHDDYVGSYNPRFNINTGYIVTGLPNKTGDRVASGVEYTFTLPIDTVTSEEGQVYSLRTRDPNMKVTKLKLSYSKTKPE